MNLLADKQVMKDMHLNSLELLHKQILSRIGELEDNIEYLSASKREDLAHAEDYYNKCVFPLLHKLEGSDTWFRHYAYNCMHHVTLFLY